MSGQEAFQDALDRLVGEGGLLGAALVRRDGIPVLGSYRRSISEEVFTAMAAAMWGAAEAALAEWGSDAADWLRVDGPAIGLAGIGLDDETLLVAVAERLQDDVHDRLQTAAQGMRAVLAG